MTTREFLANEKKLNMRCIPLFIHIKQVSRSVECVKETTSLIKERTELKNPLLHNFARGKQQLNINV